MRLALISASKFPTILATLHSGGQNYSQHASLISCIGDFPGLSRSTTTLAICHLPSDKLASQAINDATSPSMTTLEYSRRMNRVLNYIDRHLETSLNLDQLAGVANFSPYHFHRVFFSCTGETLGDYLQRRRLALGAWRLAACPDYSVLKVAVSVGFGSGEAFARAFKRHFGCTPTAWRADTPQRWTDQLKKSRLRTIIHQRNLDQGESNFDQTTGHEFLDHEDQFSEECKMDVQLMELPATRVAQMSKIGPYGAAIGEFWKTEFAPWMWKNGFDKQVHYGISHDDPSITAPEKCRYDACVEVPEDFIARGAVSVTTLPGGRYAVAEFTGTSLSIGDAWVEMFRGWLPSSGMQCDARPLFERFPKDFRLDPVTGIFSCELCIPVFPL